MVYHVPVTLYDRRPVMNLSDICFNRANSQFVVNITHEKQLPVVLYNRENFNVVWIIGHINFSFYVVRLLYTHREEMSRCHSVKIYHRQNTVCCTQKNVNHLFRSVIRSVIVIQVQANKACKKAYNKVQNLRPHHRTDSVYEFNKTQYSNNNRQPHSHVISMGRMEENADNPCDSTKEVPHQFKISNHINS